MRNRAQCNKENSGTTGEETVEQIAGLRLIQPKRWYRYSIDPFLLANFVQPRLRENVVDIGTGCGIIALLLAARHPSLHLWGIEIQKDLAGMALRNAEQNHLTKRCTVVHGDIRVLNDALSGRRFQRVVSNPPFRAVSSGRVSPLSQRAVARQELSLTFENLVDFSSRMLEHGGILDFIHLPERLAELFHILVRHGLEPKRARFVHSFPGAAPDLVLLSARKGGRPGLKIMPPMAVYESPGEYSMETRNALSSPRGSSTGLSSQKHG